MQDADSHPPDPIARFLFWLPLGLIAVAIVASVLAVPHMPERVPIHWGIDGQPTRTAAPAGAMVLSIAVMVHAWLMVGLVGWALTSGADAAALPPRVVPAISAAVVGLLALVHLAVLATGLGYHVPVPLVAVSLAGLLFILLGYKMRGVGPNPYIGVRTPTTLRDPVAWRRANDVGSRAFIYAGMATLLAALLPPPWPLAVLLGSITLAAVASVLAGRRTDREAGSRG